MPLVLRNKTIGRSELAGAAPHLSPSGWTPYSCRISEQKSHRHRVDDYPGQEADILAPNPPIMFLRFQPLR